MDSLRGVWLCFPHRGIPNGIVFSACNSIAVPARRGLCIDRTQVQLSH